MLPDASGPPPLSAPILLLLRGLSTFTKQFQIKPLKEKEQQRSLNGRPQNPTRMPSSTTPGRLRPSGLHLGCGQRRLGPSPQAPSLGLLHLSQWLQPTAFARKTRPSGLRITNGAFRAGPQVSSRPTLLGSPLRRRLHLMNMQIRPAIPAYPSGRDLVLPPEKHVGNAQRRHGGHVRGRGFCPAGLPR